MNKFCFFLLLIISSTAFSKARCPKGCPEGQICALRETICGVGDVYACQWPCEQDEDCDFINADSNRKICVDKFRSQPRGTCECPAGTILPRCLNPDHSDPNAPKVCDQMVAFQRQGLPLCK